MLFQLPVTTQDLTKPIVAIVQKVEAPKPVEYVVKDNDNLTKIAAAQNTNIERLWEKNTQLDNPDLVKAGDTIIIPNAEEVLSDRPLPVTIEPASQLQQQTSAPSGRSPVSAPRGNSAGNTYYAGQCTAYAKDRRPDLPNSLGSAGTWYSRAQAQGIPVGSVPKAGAIGMALTGTQHVVYIEHVNGDGTVFLSEQNYKGPFIISTRTAPARDFVYIY